MQVIVTVINDFLCSITNDILINCYVTIEMMFAQQDDNIRRDIFQTILVTST